MSAEEIDIDGRTTYLSRVFLVIVVDSVFLALVVGANVVLREVLDTAELEGAGSDLAAVLEWTFAIATLTTVAAYAFADCYRALRHLYRSLKDS